MHRNRILLLIQHRENYRLLSECLARDYDVVSPESSLTAIASSEIGSHDFDLCLVDSVSLNQVSPWLTAIRTKAAPLWLPVLLVAPKGTIGQLADQGWQSVDEIIAIPIEKAELMRRIGVLLRMRQFSQDLAATNRVLQERNEQLQELNRLKSQFVSMVSHEFQNPLGVVSGFLQLLVHQGDTLSIAKREEYIAKAQTTLNHLKSLVNDVLVMGRVGVGKLKLEPVELDLVQLCRNLAEEVRFNAPKPCSLSFFVTPDAEVALSAVSVDPNLLRQITTNLLTNALKYSSENKSVVFSLSYEDKQAILRIQDHGIGIPLEAHPKLFEPFYRASNVGTRSGTGLGLAIAQQCIELHGGNITFMSEVGKGTTFEVRLPL